MWETTHKTGATMVTEILCNVLWAWQFPSDREPDSNWSKSFEVKGENYMYLVCFYTYAAQMCIFICGILKCTQVIQSRSKQKWRTIITHICSFFPPIFALLDMKIYWISFAWGRDFATIFNFSFYVILRKKRDTLLQEKLIEAMFLSYRSKTAIRLRSMVWSGGPILRPKRSRGRKLDWELISWIESLGDNMHDVSIVWCYTAAA